MATIALPTDKRTAQRFIRAFRALGRSLYAEVHPVGTAPLPISAPMTLRFRGVDVLMSVGRACARPENSHDPSNLFALVRYATVLSETSNRLALSNSAKSTDPHKKSVLSDEFGCGLSLMVSRRLFGAVYFIDLHEALRRGWVRINSPRSQRPDYIARCSDGDLLVLEAKGTQSGCPASKRQVKDGCKQVTKVKVGNFQGKIKSRVAVGTALQLESQRIGTTIFVADPDEDDAVDVELNISGEELFLRSHYSRLAALAGDEVLLDLMLDGRPSGGEEWSSGELVERSIDGGTFLGRELIIDGDEERLVVFAGIRDVVRRRLLLGGVKGFWDHSLTLLAEAQLGMSPPFEPNWAELIRDELEQSVREPLDTGGREGGKRPRVVEVEEQFPPSEPVEQEYWAVAPDGFLFHVNIGRQRYRDGRNDFGTSRIKVK